MQNYQTAVITINASGRGKTQLDLKYDVENQCYEIFHTDDGTHPHGIIYEIVNYLFENFGLEPETIIKTIDRSRSMQKGAIYPNKDGSYDHRILA